MIPSTTIESIRQVFADVCSDILYLQFWYGDRYEIENYLGAYPLCMFFPELSTYDSTMLGGSNYQTNIRFQAVLAIFTLHETDTDTGTSFAYLNSASNIAEEFVQRLQQLDIFRVVRFRTRLEQYARDGSQFTSAAFLTIDLEMPSGFDYCITNPLP